MEGKLQTSFIPKKPLVENRSKSAPLSISIFSIIGWFIFTIAVLASVGIFAYEQMLNKNIGDKNKSLSTMVASFDVSSVDHFVKLNTRLQVASEILSNHLAVSNLLNLIANNTVQSVQFTDLKYTYEDGGNVSLALSGKAPNFASVALQSDTFSAQPYLQNQVFSNLGLDQAGGVLFKFVATIDKNNILYKSN